MTKKTYRALLTQINENDGPTAVELENALGVVTYTRIDAGTFKALGPFVQGRTFAYMPITEEGIDNSVIFIGEVRDGYIRFYTTMGSGTSGGGIDGILGQITGQGTPIEIIVYEE